MAGSRLRMSDMHAVKPGISQESNREGAVCGPPLSIFCCLSLCLGVDAIRCSLSDYRLYLFRPFISSNKLHRSDSRSEAKYTYIVPTYSLISTVKIMMTSLLERLNDFPSLFIVFLSYTWRGSFARGSDLDTSIV